MRFALRIYVERRLAHDGLPPRHVVRPLFADTRAESHPDLGRALTALGHTVMASCIDLARRNCHDELAPLLFSPVVESHSLESAPNNLLVVTFSALGGRLGCVPGVTVSGHAGLWFRIARGEAPAEVAANAVAQQFLVHPHAREAPVMPPPGTRAWMTTLDLELPLRSRWLSAAAGLDRGQRELESTGTPLHRSEGGTEQRAVERETELTLLSAACGASPARMVMLVGPSQVGKTQLVREWALRQSTGPRPSEVWQLSASRLLAGMSAVGEWEDRLLAILTVARRRDHVIFFDDPLGLCRAGISRQSRVSMADVLADYIEEHPLRLIAEVSQESLRIFRARAPTLADRFELQHISELPRPRVVRMLWDCARRLEQRHLVRFSPGALCEAIRLSDRFQMQDAMPGKTVNLLSDLARRCQGESIDETSVRRAFALQSGLPLSLLDDRHPLTREAVIAALSAEVCGQAKAIQAIADVVVTAKAALAEPGRPLGTLFCVGPTGVGKTHLAKVLAAYFYGDARRLLRFDMNELSDPGAAARLVGGTAGAEGLLTGAVRQQPFAVVLLDEVEKAHPDVLDLLLQILGEGRLTDADGTTSSFANTIVILTSNLGAMSGTGERAGFGSADEPSRWLTALQRFFRPELFNRIDHILTFDVLSRDELTLVAQRLLARVLARSGLARRHALVKMAPDALEHVIDAAQRSELGARALGRSLESWITQPLAAKLTTLKAREPVLLEVLSPPTESEHREARVTAHPLERARLLDQPWTDARQSIDAIQTEAAARHSALAPQLEALRPTGVLDVAALSPATLRYFAAREQSERVAGSLGRALAKTQGQPRRRHPSRPHSGGSGWAPLWLLAESELAAAWNALFQPAGPGGALQGIVRERQAQPAGDALSLALELGRELALLELLLAPADTDVEPLTLQLLAAEAPGNEWHRLAGLYTEVQAGIGLRSDSARRLRQGEVGSTLCISRDQRLSLWAIANVPRSGALLAPVSRVFVEEGFALDFSSGLLCQAPLSYRLLRQLMLSRLHRVPNS